MSDYISREALIAIVRDDGILGSGYSDEERESDVIDMIESVPAADVRPVPPGGIGELSDGYHTFNQLYYQRMMLFAALVKAYRDRAWKSYRHEDGELCFGGGWFVVGIETPEGNYTYHYENKDFDLFDCEELPVARHWDGHTEKDVTRLLSLPAMQPVKWISAEAEDKPMPYDAVDLAILGADGYGNPAYYTTIGTYENGGWIAFTGQILSTEKVTHWKPRQEPPEVE